MISRKELEYVSTWTRKVPYPGYEYNISFSNSEEITLEILSSNIAHMLGIDHKELMSTYKMGF